MKKSFAAIVHWTTVGLIATAVLAATGVGFAQSWAGLYGWAVEHQLQGWKAMSFPAMVDLFIAIGELGLFKIAIEGHTLRRALLPWLDLLLPLLIATAGWTASLAFNVGHVGGTGNDKLTAGVPPVASMLGLFVLLRTLHRVVAQTSDDADMAGLPEALPIPDTDAAGHDAENSSDDNSSDGDDTAGQEPVTSLASAVRAARANGVTKATLMREFAMSRYTLDKILDQQAPDPDVDSSDSAEQDAPAVPSDVLAFPVPASVNGSQIVGADQ